MEGGVEDELAKVGMASLVGVVDSGMEMSPKATSFVCVWWTSLSTRSRKSELVKVDD